jgi:predicted nucleotidyltransferase
MSSTSLDFFRRPELALHAEIVAAVEDAAARLRVTPLIAGAFARDLHLLYGHGIDPRRMTDDIDFAFAVPDWEAFHAIRAQLIESGRFTPRGSSAHALNYRGGLSIDVVPFGAIETSDRTIAWPPRGDVVMNVFGYREALADTRVVVFPGDVRSQAVSLAALALLKIVCWRDRHYALPLRDAHDLMFIVRNYLQAGQQERLYDDFVHWTQDEDFDFEVARARILGYDIRALLDYSGRNLVRGVLAEQVSGDGGRLPTQMSPHDPKHARRLLEAMIIGMT